MNIAEVISKHSERICVEFDEQTCKEHYSDLVIISELQPLLKDLMNGPYKNVSANQVVRELIDLDSQQIIVKALSPDCHVDKSLVKRAIAEKKLAESRAKIGKELTIEEAQKELDAAKKRLAAYQELADTDGIARAGEQIDNYNKYILHVKAYEGAKLLKPEIITLRKPLKYFQFTDLIEKGRVDVLEMWLDSFRELDKADIIKSIPHQENKTKFLQACKLLFPNVKADSVHICANAVAEFIQKIYFNLGESTYNPQKMLFLYSMLGGTGKGVFMNRLIHFCDTYKIPVGRQANISSHWLSPEFSKNVVSVIPEFFPFKSNMNEQIINMNNIIDNTNYIMELKGQQPISLKSNTTMICGSNKKPFDVNDRRYNVVEYNTVQLFDGAAVEHYKDVLHTEYMPEDWDRVFYDLFTSCPFNYKFTAVSVSNYVPDQFADFIENVRFLKESNTEFCVEPHTVKDIAKALQINDDGKFNQSYSKEYRKEVLKNIYGLCSANYLKPAVKINGKLEYSKYRLTDIASLVTSSDDITVTSDLSDPIYETVAAWDILIGKYTNPVDNNNNNNNPDGGNRHEQEDETYKQDSETEERASIPASNVPAAAEPSRSKHQELGEVSSSDCKRVITSTEAQTAEQRADDKAAETQERINQTEEYAPVQVHIQPDSQDTERASLYQRVDDYVEGEHDTNLEINDIEEAISDSGENESEMQEQAAKPVERIIREATTQVQEQVQVKTRTIVPEEQVKTRIEAQAADCNEAQADNFEAELESVVTCKKSIESIEGDTSYNIIRSKSEGVVVTEPDINKFDFLTVKDKYSKPGRDISDSNQFLISARYKPEYKKQAMAEGYDTLNRKGDNMLPVFFVYEMDDLELDKQYAIAEMLQKNHIWTITNSGHKSLHTLVYINPDQAEEIAKDFKHYWNVVAEKLYGKTAKYLDKACASIGRLTRFPDGIRDDGSRQYCEYYNINVTPIDLSEEIKKHNSELQTQDMMRAINHVIHIENANKFKGSKSGNPYTDAFNHLKACVAKSGNESGQLAIDLLEGLDPGSGANYIGAVGYCRAAIPEYPLYKEVQNAAHRLHPSNISLAA